MHQERQPQYPLFYSVSGYQYCELLLADVWLRIRRECERLTADWKLEASATKDGTAFSEIPYLQSEIESLRNRAETALHISRTTAVTLLDQGLNHLALGPTWQAAAELRKLQTTNPQSQLDQAEHHLSQSVTLLRQAGTQHHMPRGLLHRAALWRDMLDAFGWPRLLATGVAERQEASDADTAPSCDSTTQVDEQPVLPEVEELLANAERDLSEAETIADRGSMLIFQIEAALERTHLLLTLASAVSAPLRDPNSNDAPTDAEEAHAEAHGSQSEFLQQAREKLDETRRLVKQTEKPYEPHVPDWDEWEPPEYVGVFKAGDIVGYHCRNDDIERLQAEIDALIAAS